MLGQAEKISIDKDNTTIINGNGDLKLSKAVLARSALRLRTLHLITIKKNYRNV